MRSLVVMVVFFAAVSAVGAVPRGKDDIYMYRTARGQIAFVNGLERVPAAYRARAKRKDLSHISTNGDLAPRRTASVPPVKPATAAPSAEAPAGRTVIDGFKRRLPPHVANAIAEMEIMISARNRALDHAMNL